MRKYYDTESNEIYTEDQLSAFWFQSERLDNPDFDKWLAKATGKNGTLELIAPDYEIENLRRWAAKEIARNSDIPYDDILECLRENNVFGTRTMYEINNRPVDLDELQEIIEEQYY